MIEGNAGAIILKQTFGGGKFLVATATATPIASLLFSSIWGVLCAGRPKLRLATLFGAGAALCAATVAFTPRSPFGATLFVIQMAAAQIFLSGLVTVRAALWRHNYPPEARGKIAARLQAIRMLVGIGTLTTASFIFDKDPTLYRWIYPFVAICGLGALLILQKLHIRHEKSELRHPHSSTSGVAQNAPSLRALSPSYIVQQITRLLHADPHFARYLAFQMCFGFSVQFVQPVLVEIVGNANSSYTINFLILDIIPKIMVFASLSRWGHLFDRIGVLRFRVLTGSCAAIGLLCGLAATIVLGMGGAEGPYIKLALGLFFLRSILHGLHMGGGSLAWNLGHLHFTKGRDAEVYMGVHQTLTGIRGLLSPYIGILLFWSIGWGVWVVSVLLCVISILGFHSLARTERTWKS